MRGKKQKEPAGMNPGEIFAALELLEQERGIPKEAMLEKVIKAIITAYQRDHKDVEEENIVVEADEEHRELRMFVRKTVVDEGHIPITPHLFFKDFMDDHDPEERKKAMEMSKQLLERCDEVWVFDENGTSEGMKGEIELASQLGKQVRYR